MPLEIIGAGYGRTGTLSLKLALERLGFVKCYHVTEVFGNPEHVPLWAAAHRGEPVDWEKLYAGYRATVDWPSCNLWREHATLYPDAKVILTTRDPDSWYQSVMNTIYVSSTRVCESSDPTMRRFGEWACKIVWENLFDNRMQDRDHVIGVYNAHVERVEATIPKSHLLVFEAKQGWGRCANFWVSTPPRIRIHE